MSTHQESQARLQAEFARLKNAREVRLRVGLPVDRIISRSLRIILGAVIALLGWHFAIMAAALLSEPLGIFRFVKILSCGVVGFSLVAYALRTAFGTHNVRSTYEAKLMAQARRNSAAQ